jgi:hypothetical protein
MRFYRLSLVTGGLAGCLLSAPRNASAQDLVYYTYSVRATDAATCRGFTGIHRALWSHSDPKKDNVNVSYPVVADLDPRSPAGVAKLATGDSLVTVNGYSTLGAMPIEIGVWNTDAGDHNTLKVKRGARTLELTLYMGEWVTLPGDSTVRNPITGERTQQVCRPAK